MDNNMKIFLVDYTSTHIQCQPGFYFNFQIQTLHHRNIKLYEGSKNNIKIMKMQNKEKKDTEMLN